MADDAGYMKDQQRLIEANTDRRAEDDARVAADRATPKRTKSKPKRKRARRR